MAVLPAQSRKRNTGRSRANVQRKLSVSSSNLPKVLRIGVIQGGKIIEEKIIRKRETVTVGPSEKSDFVIPSQDAPGTKFELFETKGGPYTLNFTAAMNGRVSVGGQVVDLTELRTTGKAGRRGDKYQLVLSEQTRGKVVLGESTILFQFVAPPPIQPRPQLPAAVRGSLFANLGALITVCWLFFFLAEAGVIAWWETTDWPVISSWDKYLELQDQIAAADIPEVREKVKKVDEGEGDEEAEEDDEESESTKKVTKSSRPDQGPKRSAAEIARERAEKRAQLAAQLAERGINKILGTLGGEGSGAIADVLAGGDVAADQDGLLSQVIGVGVATGDMSGSLAGPAGGKGGGEAAGLQTEKVGGGNKSVKTGGPGEERKIKGSVKRRKPSASGGTGMLNPQDVHKVVGRKIGALKSCYEQALKRDPSLRGKITIKFTISGSGKVTSAKDVLNELTPAVGSCMVRAFKRFRFPPPEGGTVTFEYPFMFTPAG